MPQRYRIEICYDGTAYHGWQTQPNAKSIQETLNSALSTFLREEINCVGCGRTDTGVHAKRFTVHFDCDQVFQERDFIYRMNRVLPRDIAVLNTQRCDKDFHARFDATSRTYRYYLVKQKDPFAVDRKWEFRTPLNLDVMNKACQSLMGEHDFSSFSKSNTQTETNLCKVTAAHWIEDVDTIMFEVTANRFLRNMVRAMVGTMVDVGVGKTSLEEFEAILASKNRSEAGSSVPAHGLYLWEIKYPQANDE